MTSFTCLYMYVHIYIFLFMYLFIYLFWSCDVSRLHKSRPLFSVGWPADSAWETTSHSEGSEGLRTGDLAEPCWARLKADSRESTIWYLSQGRDGSFDGLSHHASRPQGGWWMEASSWDEEQKQAKQESTGGRSGQWPWEHQVQIHWWIQMRWGWRKRCNEQGNLVRTTHY